MDRAHWNDSLLKVSFWGLNGGLFLMSFGTLLPVGLMQTYPHLKATEIKEGESVWDRLGVEL